jgi:hypothetical protein
MIIVSDLRSCHQAHQELQVRETKHVVPKPVIEVVRPHVRYQIEPVIPDHEMQVHGAREIFSRMQLVSWKIDIDDSLPGIRIFDQFLAAPMELVDVNVLSAAEDLVAVSRVNGTPVVGVFFPDFLDQRVEVYQVRS